MNGKQLVSIIVFAIVLAVVVVLVMNLLGMPRNTAVAGGVIGAMVAMGLGRIKANSTAKP